MWCFILFHFHRKSNQTDPFRRRLLYTSLFVVFISGIIREQKKYILDPRKLLCCFCFCIVILYSIEYTELKYCFTFFLTNGGWLRLLHKNIIVCQDFGPTFHIQFPYSLLCTRESKYNSILRESFHWIFSLNLDGKK